MKHTRQRLAWKSLSEERWGVGDWREIELDSSIKRRRLGELMSVLTAKTTFSIVAQFVVEEFLINWFFYLAFYMFLLQVTNYDLPGRKRCLVSDDLVSFINNYEIKLSHFIKRQKFFEDKKRLKLCDPRQGRNFNYFLLKRYKAFTLAQTVIASVNSNVFSPKALWLE